MQSKDHETEAQARLGTGGGARVHVGSIKVYYKINNENKIIVHLRIDIRGAKGTFCSSVGVERSSISWTLNARQVLS